MVRSQADHARYNLAKQRDALRARSKAWPSKDEVLVDSDPRFADVLVNVTNDDLKRISDEDIIFIAEHDPGLDGRQLTGFSLMSVMPGWDPSDVFFESADPATLAQDEGQGSSDQKFIPPKSARGRGPADWWPEAFAQFGDMIVRDEDGDTQAQIIEALMLRLQNAGFEGSRSTLQPAVKRFMELQKH